ncbi:MAG: uracil-DNA glycosylase family protein [Balneola sp.]
MQKLLEEIRACTECEKNLPLGPRPIVTASASSKIAIIGQAPGTAVHKSGIPWDDPSGRRLREWMGINDDVFYDETNVAIIPMGFCYPGKGKSGDLPPRPECAPLWHKPLLESITDLKLTLLIGQYAQRYYLKDRMKRTLTDTVKNYSEYLPEFLPLPHPSPRNNIWLKRNEWFELGLVPKLKKIIDSSL